MKTRFGLVISIAVAFVAISTAVLAQQEDVEELSQRATEGEAIDEITVYGEQSMSSLRYQIYRAEEDFFDLFSELNDDDEFDVSCFYETPTGTRRRFHVCRAQFVIDAYSRAASRFIDGVAGPFRDPEVVIMQKSGEFEEKMLQLIAENPNLKEALDQYTSARTNYESERARRYPGMAEEDIPEE